MTRTILPIFFALLLVLGAMGQGRSADNLRAKIRELKAERVLTLTYDAASNTSKLMAIAENFSQKEAERAGVKAMNFGIAFTFATKDLTAEPEKINLTFWVLTKKPQFAESHRWTARSGSTSVDLGDARYVAKPADEMEYLNFVVTRDDLTKIAVPGTSFTLGNSEFTFTPAQTKMLNDMLTISALK